MLVHLLILNYNGRALLAECLPSVLLAAESSRHRCDVAVIDNSSTDGSAEWLADHFPTVRVIRCPNRGLCSYNEVVAALRGRIAVLLNNDVKLDRDCLDPLLRPLVGEQSDCFMTAPRCYQFDETTYEGFRTAVRWRWGLVQATALFPGHVQGIHQPGPTASSGAVMAVDRRKFVELGGFDPLYLPGRIEDLDLAFRGWLHGYCACYVPEALSWHKGMVTFAERFGVSGCDRLALRNTLLFEWKNVRHPANVALALAGLAVRWGVEVAFAPWTSPSRRWTLTAALAAAWRRWRQVREKNKNEAGGEGPSGPDFARPRGKLRREFEFFRRFSPRRMAADAAHALSSVTAGVMRTRRPAARPGADSVPAGPVFAERSRKVCQLP
ncbi:MAG TPA: glycosyltransferase [Thermoguttaceae bacterium]|nr:glycosyltransferase [Thermoguttaceae bacterium]